MDCRRCQNVATVLRAGGHKVYRRPHKDDLETTQALFANFGAHRAPLQSSAFIHGLRFLTGLRLTAGGLVAVGAELVGVVATGVAMGNANVGDGKADAGTDAPGEGDAVIPGDGEGVGLGVGEGAMMFSQ